MTPVQRALDHVIDRTALARALLVLAPSILAAFWTGGRFWMPAALVTASSFIAMEKASLAPVGVAWHGAAIAVGFLLLTAALPYPPVFAILTAAVAASGLLLTAKGQRLRTPGNFVFIPALYLACEVSETVHGSGLARGLVFLPYLLAALVPVLLLSWYEHARDHEPTTPRRVHFGRVRRISGDFGQAVPVAEGVVAIAGAVALAALFVTWRHAPHAQWVIWSAASVVTGDVASARRKLGDRALGAFIGVPLGLALALAAPHTHWMLRSVAVGGLLTLIIFRIYPIAFGARCTLIALGLSLAGELSGAAERIENVLIGGAIGIVFVLVAHEAARLVRERRARIPFGLNSKGVLPCLRLTSRP